VLDTFEEADDDDLDDGEADSPPTDPRTAGDAARPDEHEEVDDDAIPFAEP
jgi:hypothetical protein